VQPLARSRKVSLWLNGEFDYFAVDQMFAGEKVRRDRLSTASLSLNGYAYFQRRLRAGVGVAQGLKAMTIDELWRAVGSICDLYDPEECQNYFTATGHTYD
jgi:hypothetical protein